MNYENYEIILTKKTQKKNKIKQKWKKFNKNKKKYEFEFEFLVDLNFKLETIPSLDTDETKIYLDGR